MRNLAAGNIVDDVLKSIWMQRLPTSIQQILSVSKDSLDGLAQIADKVNEVSSFRPEVNAVVSENSELRSLREEVANLRAELKRITCSRFRRAQSSKRESSNTRVRRSSHTRTDNPNLLCCGAAVSCFPRRLTNFTVPQDLVLYAANGSVIKSYGTKALNLDLGLRRKFSWTFIVADVSHPIFVSDFLERFGLLVDVKNRRVIDNFTHLNSCGVKAPSHSLGLTLISNQSPYHSILSKFSELLSPVSGNVSASHNVEHCIETRRPPVFSKARRLSPEKLKFLREEFQTLMEQGIIRPSNSAYASPVHLVKKQNGDWRICGDFRRLNSITISDCYPLPHIQDFSHGLAGKTVFSKIDPVKGYRQIPIKSSDIHKTAVITPIGLFEYTCMTFGLKNAAQSFQMFIDQVLLGLDCSYAYLDDILIASENEDQHKLDVEKVFQRLTRIMV
ncbi:Transposon Ty3-I Gag-Pol polyprotein [Araneus ventricosus]|uniref:Transposon Ty3-I Gag-Pol polyprotein n=1 Tax=Araneus ventricosus TaxID=182803 RepID=A0A4Y2BI71_ARAVE|nr:Transposon Ty3-I Gag-Pol polyprotein [Araneus ventricosus]